MFSEVATAHPDARPASSKIHAMRRVVDNLRCDTVDAVKFYFVDAMRWRMEAALKTNAFAVEEESRLVIDDVRSWLEEFGFNVPTEFGYLLGRDSTGDLKIVRRHPIRDVGLDFSSLLSDREDMRAVYRKAKEHLPEAVRYREDDNVMVMDYLTQRFAEVSDSYDRYFLWASPPPPVTEGSKQVGYGSSTHISVFRLESQGDFQLIHGVTVISELSNFSTRDYIQRIVSPTDPRYQLVQDLPPHPTDRDLLQLAFELRQGLFSEHDMRELAWRMGNELLAQAVSGSEPNLDLLAKHEAYLAEQRLALHFAPIIHMQLQGLIDDLIHSLKNQASGEALESMLSHIWRVGRDAYSAHLIQALERESGRSFTKEERADVDYKIKSNFDTRAQGRGCPSMGVEKNVQGIPVSFDATKGVYVDKDGNEYSPEAKVTCKHCNKEQYLVVKSTVKTKCEFCGKSPCDAIEKKPRSLDYFRASTA